MSETPQSRKLNIANLVAVSGAGILMVAQSVMVAFLGSWALVGILNFSDVFRYPIIAAFLICTLWLCYKFVRQAVKMDPIFKE